jgi:hypothetical protein
MIIIKILESPQINKKKKRIFVGIMYYSSTTLVRENGSDHQNHEINSYLRYQLDP